MKVRQFDILKLYQLSKGAKDMNAQLFKTEALNRLAVNLPAAVPVMGKVDIDKVMKVVKVESGEVNSHQNSRHI